MNKKILSIIAFFAVKSLFSSNQFNDELIYSSMAIPLEESIPFCQGFTHQNGIESITPVSWSGLGPKFEIKKDLNSSLAFSRTSILVGPENPDPMSNFIVGAHLPIILGQNNDDHLNEKFSSFLTLTGRGFFGKNSGILSNLELVFQLGTKIPGTKSLTNKTNFSLLSAENNTFKETQTFFEARNALLVSLNFHLIPNRLRIGAFFGLSPFISNFEYLNQLGSLTKSTLLSGLDKFWSKKTDTPEKTGLLPVDKKDNKADKLKATEQAKEKSPTAISLATIGMLAEMSFWDERLFFGGIVKKTKIPGAYLTPNRLSPHFKEISLFTRTNSLSALENNYVSFPELKLSCGLIFNQSSFKVEKSMIGFSAKITF